MQFRSSMSHDSRVTNCHRPAGQFLVEERPARNFRLQVSAYVIFIRRPQAFRSLVHLRLPSISVFVNQWARRLFGAEVVSMSFVSYPRMRAMADIRRVRIHVRIVPRVLVQSVVDQDQRIVPICLPVTTVILQLKGVLSGLARRVHVLPTVPIRLLTCALVESVPRTRDLTVQRDHFMPESSQVKVLPSVPVQVACNPVRSLRRNHVVKYRAG